MFGLPKRQLLTCVGGACFPRFHCRQSPLFHFHDELAPDQDVVVTGIGIVSPLAVGREATWRRLLAGDKAGRLLSPDEIDHHGPLTELLNRTPAGAPVDHAAVKCRAEAVWSSDAPHEFRPSFKDFGHDVLNNLVIVALAEALDDAGLKSSHFPAERTGCVIGTSKASLRAMESVTASAAAGLTSQNNMFLNGFLSDAPLRTALAMLGTTGPASCPVAACATGLISVIQAAELVHSGLCDICIAGSADASLRASVLASFHRLGVTSKRTDPSTACRPFDRDRDGFIIGEGAAVFVIESRRHAEARQANCYGRVTAGGWLTDPTGLTQINSDGPVVAETIRCLLMAQRTADADRHALQPDFCSLHGTGTVANDLAEANGLSAILPESTPCYGVKGSIGHLLGAAGSVEFATALLALRDQIIPATSNLEHQDPRCHIDLKRHQRQISAVSGLKLSLGFGGHIAACQVRRTD